MSDISSFFNNINCINNFDIHNNELLSEISVGIFTNNHSNSNSSSQINTVPNDSESFNQCYTFNSQNSFNQLSSNFLDQSIEIPNGLFKNEHNTIEIDRRNEIEYNDLSFKNFSLQSFNQISEHILESNQG
jgi:hypothetical protein